MFQFPGFAPLARYYAFSIVGCPIRTPADQFVFANPRSFSQLITSFFASESLGIPHTPFLTSLFLLWHRCLRSLCARCSIVVNCLTPILFYYLFLTLILQYVNELFVSTSHAILFLERLVPYGCITSDNVIM